MNPVTQLPRHPRRRGFLNDDASLETASRPIHLLRTDASPAINTSSWVRLTISQRNVTGQHSRLQDSRGTGHTVEAATTDATKQEPEQGAVCHRSYDGPSDRGGAAPISDG
jgi:hypothetical protein